MTGVLFGGEGGANRGMVGGWGGTWDEKEGQISRMAWGGLA